MNNSAKKKIVIIIGMHRSGTSALTRVCNLLGVELGDNLLERNEYNEQGFWENVSVVSIHEKIQEVLYSSWDDVSELPQDWHHTEVVVPYRDQLTALIAESISQYPLWGVKDPRISRLFPIWKDILAKLQCEPLFLFALRNPLEVAASLQKRDDFSLSKSLLLWLKHNLDAERYTRGYRRSFIYYPALLSNWRSEIDRVTRETGIEWPVFPDAVTAEIESFLSDDLKHHKAEESLELHPQVNRWVREVFSLLKLGSEGKVIDTSALDTITKEVESYCRGYEDVIRSQNSLLFTEFHSYKAYEDQIGDLQYQVNQKTAEVEHFKGMFNNYREEYDKQSVAFNEAVQTIEHMESQFQMLKQKYEDITSSTIWRMTEPLRKVLSSIRKT